MQIFGKYEADYKKACRLFVRERELFYYDLKTISYLHVIPSQANFFLCEVHGGVWGLRGFTVLAYFSFFIQNSNFVAISGQVHPHQL